MHMLIHYKTLEMFYDNAELLACKQDYVSSLFKTFICIIIQIIAMVTVVKYY